MIGIKYSRKIADLAEVVIIDGRIVKNRGEDVKSGLLGIKSLDNVVIQVKEDILIHCISNKKLERYIQIIKELKDTYDEDFINSRIKFIQ